MHELEAKLKPIGEMKEKLTEWMKSELDKGKECVDAKEAGEVVDMIKDLAEAEEKCVKAAYYKCIVKAMKEEEELMDGRMGYDNYRYSSGRFAPKGHGSYRPGESGRSGFTPVPYYDDPKMAAEGWWGGDRHDMMGYPTGNRSQGGNDGRSSSGSMDNTGSSGGRMGYSDPDMERIMSDERHGRAYKDWRLAKRHYTETKSDGDKHEMSEHAKEHMADTVMTLKEIWADADPALREKMKKDLTALMAEMK